MIGASMDLPDTILSGDPKVGNLATARALDRPTELAMTSRQKLWADVYEDLCNYALDWQVRATRGKLSGTVEYDDDMPIVDHQIDAAIEVKFPDVLEHDPVDAIRAIVLAATLDGRPAAGTLPDEVVSRLLAARLGVEDVDEMVVRLAPQTKAKIDPENIQRVRQADEAFAEAAKVTRWRVGS
jgi:hypothetical protein